MSKINHIHLYRNGAVLGNRAAAETRLKEFASESTYTDLDGVAILARYNSEKNGILTLVGIMYEDQSGAKSITIIDVEDLKSDAKVEVDELKKAIEGLKGNSSSTSGETSVEGAKRYTDNKIGELDVTDTEVANEYVSSVSETDGKISVVRKAIPIVSVNDAKEDNKFVTSIKLEGNTVKAERAQITSSQVTREATDIKATDVEGALAEVKTSSKVVLTSTTPTDTQILKKYTLTQNGESIGDIDIPKDLVVTSGSVVKGTWSDEGVFTEAEDGNGTALKLVIANQENTPVYINTLDLVKDHVGGNGISISDTNVISIKIADGNEGDFLQLGAEGLKLVGVDAAIKKSATVVEKKADDAHITVDSTVADGHVVYTIGSNDVASSTSLTDEINHRKAIEGQTGDTYTANTGATYISGATSLNEADIKLDEALKNLSASVGKAAILEGNGISADKTSTDGTKVSVKLDNGEKTYGSGLQATENGLSINLSEITLDCGTYA